MQCFKKHIAFCVNSIKNKEYLQWIFAFIFGLGGLLYTFHWIPLSRFLRIPGDIGDVRINNYFLEHTWSWLLRKPLHRNFWNLPIFYPETNVTAYSDVMVSFAPFYWIGRALGFQPDVAYLSWFLLMGLINFYLMYILLRTIFKSSFIGSLLGSFIFAFAISRVTQIGHPQLFPMMFFLGSIIAIYRYFSAFSNKSSGYMNFQRRLWISIFFLCIVLQFYGGFYNGYFLLLMVFIIFSWSIIIERYRIVLANALIRDWWFIITGGIISCLLLLPLVKHYSDVSKLLGSRSWQHVLPMLPRPQTWIYCGNKTFFYRWMNRISIWNSLPMRHEHGIGIGFLTMSIMVWVAIKYRKRPSIFFIFLTTFTTMILTTLFLNKYTFWMLIWDVVPGASALRAVTRIGMLMGIPAGIGIALFIDTCWNNKRILLAISLVLLCCLEQKASDYSFPYLEERRPVQKIAEQIDTNKEAFIVTVNGDSSPYPPVVQIDAMIASELAGVPTINGYTGHFPHDWWFFWDANTKLPENREQFLNHLELWATKYGLSLENIQWIELDSAYRQ